MLHYMQIVSRPVVGTVSTFDDGMAIPASGGSIHRIYMRHQHTDAMAAVGAALLILHLAMPLASIVGLCDVVVIGIRYGLQQLNVHRGQCGAQQYYALPS